MNMAGFGWWRKMEKNCFSSGCQVAEGQGFWVNVDITKNNDRNSELVSQMLESIAKEGMMRMLVDDSNKELTSVETASLSHQVSLYPLKGSHGILYISCVTLITPVWHSMLVFKKADLGLSCLFPYLQCLPNTRNLEIWFCSSFYISTRL